MSRIATHKELRVFQAAMDAAMDLFEITKTFPTDERFSMVDQIRRSSRSVCADIAEAWRKRRYSAAFVAKLNDAESKACEAQVWLQFALRCGYITREVAEKLDRKYDEIIGQLVGMISNPQQWVIQ